MEQTLPTRGEMERSLSQHIQAFYRNKLGCSTGKINCHILNNQVAIAIENSITPIEKMLDNPDDCEFRRDLRNRIDTIVKRELLSELETVLKVKVVDMTINTTLDNNFTGVVVLLSASPLVRLPKQVSRSRSNKKS
ncbi:MAG: Na-translocating system protein MpsC family protein [Xenococcaceae cyanobacterium MO_188.B29]|nr:Na-translocating system protein MpsC family protein [Xenococcaceae cyanobacterium MO_188.B29]